MKISQSNIPSQITLAPVLTSSNFSTSSFPLDSKLSSETLKLIDVDELHPILGLERKIGSLKESLMEMPLLGTSFETAFQLASQNVHRFPSGLSIDAVMAIFMLIIMSDEPNSVFNILNSKLIKADRNELSPYFPFLQVILSGFDYTSTDDSRLGFRRNNLTEQERWLSLHF